MRYITEFHSNEQWTMLKVITLSGNKVLNVNIATLQMFDGYVHIKNTPCSS